MKKCKWSDISKYRGELFGIAIISVIILHYIARFNAPGTNRILRFIANVYSGAVGSVGVDIFVFLSGYGLYYSLCKRKSLKSFYQKRFQRVLFPYLVWGLIFWVIKDLIILKETFGTFILDYSLLSFWMRGVQTFWYIAFICLMYLLSPVFFELIKDRRKTIITVAVLCGISVLCYMLYPDCFHNTEIALQRLPSFPIGMYCGKLSQDSAKGEKQDISTRLMFVLLLSVPIKIVLGLMDHPLARLFNGYYAVFLIVAYVMIRNAMANPKSRFFGALSIIGAYSLELYVVHIAIRNLFGTLQYDLQNPFIYLLHLVITVPLAMCFALLQKIKLFKDG